MDMLELSIIDEVRDALGDDAYLGYAMRMISEMHGIGPMLAEQLAAGDRDVLAQTAHKAAGSAVAVGANGLHRRLKAIEDAARSDGAALSSLVAGFGADVTATEAAIKALSNAP